MWPTRRGKEGRPNADGRGGGRLAIFHGSEADVRGTRGLGPMGEMRPGEEGIKMAVFLRTLSMDGPVYYLQPVLFDSN